MKTRSIAVSILAAVALSLSSAMRLQADDSAAIAEKIRAAKKGTVVQLPAGTFKIGNLVLGDGVSLVGTGYNKTIIDATGNDFGITVSGHAAARLSDLAVVGASQGGIVLDGANGVIVQRVSVRHCGSGLIARGAGSCALNNLILADCPAGVSLLRCQKTSLVNATVANIEGTALRIDGCKQVAVFNNLCTFAAYGIRVSGENADLSIDHNLYIANFVGQLAGETVRKKVESWHHLSGFDKHSLMIGVTFRDPAAGDYRPVSPLSWAPVRATTSDWGVKSLEGVEAPDTDIDGHPRVGAVDLGAYETSFPAPRPADGTFTVQSGSAGCSAGLFNKQRRCVRYLFQNLPLAAGTYPYWLPSRDWQGEPIDTGHYLLRFTEADMRLEYIAAAGNGDQAMSTTNLGSVSKRCSLDPNAVAFDVMDHLLVAQGGSESGQHVKEYDPEMTHFLWSFPGGGETMGITVDAKGRVLVLRKNASLIRLSSATGKGENFPNETMEKSYPEAFKSIDGMTWMNDRLYVADPVGGKLSYLTGEGLDVAGSFAIPDVMQPAADVKAGLIWAISGKELIAVDDKGAVLHRATPVEQPILLAYNAGRLAVYSAATRKISVLDSSNPAKLKLLHTIGTGGDGYGKMQADRFWAPRSLAMNSKGQIAVSDAPRVCLFDADGATKKMHMGMWGQAISYGWFAGDDRVHFFNIGGGYDILLDAKSRSWEPGTRWRYTMDVSPVFFFNAGGKDFAVCGMHIKNLGSSMAVVRMENDGVGRVLARYFVGNQGLVVQRNAGGAGIINDTDPAEPVLGSDGKQIQERLFDSLTNTDTRTDGSLSMPDGRGVLVVPMTGLDDKGVPRYDFAARRLIAGTVDGSPSYVSPYDFKTQETVRIGGDLSHFPAGDFIAAMTTATGAGPDPATEHANATSMAGFDKDGKLRWFWPMNPKGLRLGFHGITTIGGITFAGRGMICEYETMDHDGLGTGVLGMPRAFGWSGMWLDNHRQTQGFTGNDGKPYLITGDYAEQSYHWTTPVGWDKIIHHEQPVVITEALAATLQAEFPAPVPVWPVPPPPTVVIRKLAAPLPIDGDLAKWRTLGIQPIVISAVDPAENSAVVRFGYVEDALYVQIIKFDKTLTFHQRDPGRHYCQDGIELNLQTFWTGWKYNATRLNNKDDIILRDRFMGAANILLDPTATPRKIKILDSAAEVPERKLLESSTGADLSACKVMVIEFKLGKAALDGLPADRLLKFKSGGAFLFGITINHNSVAGSDMFAPVNWPVTYGPFSRDNDFATAVFE